MKYNHFLFFNDYFIDIYNINEIYQYLFFEYNNKNYLYIKNKNLKHETIKFKIIKIQDNILYEYEYILENIKHSLILLKNISSLYFKKTTSKDIIYTDYSNIVQNIHYKYPKFNSLFYDQSLFNLLSKNKNNKLSNNFNNDDDNEYNDVNNDNIINKFLHYNWYYYGSKNKMHFFKYCIYKNKEHIEQLKYPFIDYDESKTKALIFIDDRFDKILFQLITHLFLYSVDDSWNLHIFTIKEQQYKFQNVLDRLNVKAKFHFISKINNINEYSNLLKSSSFWDSINEENLLLYQYDSIAFGKFNSKFLNYPYIGARWPENITQLKGIYNGNGGTSFRKKSYMSYITSKYNYFLYDPNFPEDKYFAKYLHQEDLHHVSNELLDEFSIENIFNDYSIYGHAIFEIISLNKLDDFITNRIKNMLNK